MANPLPSLNLLEVLFFLSWFMRPVWAIGLYLVFVFVGGALLAPWLFLAAQTLAQTFPSFESIASKPFPRYLNRCFLVLAVLGLRPFLRAADLCSWRSIGLAKRSDAVRQLGAGFLLGWMSLAVVVVLAVGAGDRVWSSDLTLAKVGSHIVKAAATALIVGPLEEILFRGALFGSLRKSLHWSLALVVSSGIYAILHFFDRAEAPAAIGWHSGLVVLGRMVGGFTEMQKLFPGFLNLAVVGMILGLAYQRTASLHFPIGLHAGWIFWLKSYGFLTDGTAASRTWLFGTNKLINGWLSFVILAIVLALLFRMLAQQQPPSGRKERRNWLS